MAEFPAQKAFNVLNVAICDAETHADSKAYLAEFAGRVLRQKGQYVIAKEGMYGGSRDLIGSSEPETYLAQATAPVEVARGMWVALRDKPQEPSASIELIKFSAESADTDKLLLTDDQIKVFAEFSGEKDLDIPGVQVTHYEIAAIGFLLEEINDRIEETNSPVPSLPAIGDNSIRDGLHKLEELDHSPGFFMSHET